MQINSCLFTPLKPFDPLPTQEELKSVSEESKLKDLA